MIQFVFETGGSVKFEVNLKEKFDSLSCTFTVYNENCIDGLMVSMLVLSAVDRGFEPRSSQTKDYKFGICCFSANHAALRRKSKD
jgi:hypothetical protein